MVTYANLDHVLVNYAICIDCNVDHWAPFLLLTTSSSSPDGLASGRVLLLGDKQGRTTVAYKVIHGKIDAVKCTKHWL